MKVVGKMGNNYMVSIPKEELLEFVFGETSPQYNEKIKSSVYKFTDDIDKGDIVNISVSKIFKKAISLSHTKISGGYDSLMAKLDAIKGLVTPIELFVSELNNEIHNPND